MPTRAVAQGGRGEAIVALLGPAAVAQPLLGLVELAHRAKQDPERGVGHLLGQHVWACW